MKTGKNNRSSIPALKQVKGILRENELCEFFIELNSVSVGFVR